MSWTESTGYSLLSRDRKRNLADESELLALSSATGILRDRSCDTRVLTRGMAARSHQAANRRNVEMEFLSGFE